VLRASTSTARRGGESNVDIGVFAHRQSAPNGKIPVGDDARSSSFDRLNLNELPCNRSPRSLDNGATSFRSTRTTLKPFDFFVRIFWASVENARLCYNS